MIYHPGIGTDHMKGLYESDRPFIDHLQKPGVFLYCTEISAHFLTSKYPKFSYLKSKIVTLQPNVPSQVQVRGSRENDDDQEITVLAIPAGHCPGSVMFLFEGRESTVLYTGDLRVMKGDLRKFRQLQCGNTSARKIDTLYMDTTFFNQSYWMFPSREQSTHDTCDIVSKWISNGPTHHTCLLLPAWTGTEYLFTRVAKCFNTKIHVLPELFSILRYIPEVEDAITRDAHATQIHAVQKRRFSDMDKHLKGMHIKKIYLSAAGYKNKKSDTKVAWCKDSDDPCFANVCYSSHCSYSELEDIIQYLKPCKVFPCVKPFHTSRETVRVLMEELGVPQVDLSIFSEDDNSEKQVLFNKVDTFENKIELMLQNKVFTDHSCDAETKINVSSVLDPLVDSPPPKRRSLQSLTLS